MKSSLCLLFCFLLSIGTVRAEVDPAEGAGQFDDSQLAAIEKQQQQFEFQAEVNRLMDIIINSLYKEREVFLRELISNAADAVDKFRYQKLKSGAAVSEDQFWIHVKADPKENTITISDSGIGMTREELIKNLGIVARSGTTEFVEAATKGTTDPLTLIGQFGVGFYSVYLVADKVTVVSKSANDDQHIWQSKADRTFTVSPDPRGNTLGQGTAVVIHLKEDAKEFLDEATLEKLIGRYSQFINYPISLWSNRTVTKEVPVEEEPKATSEDLEVSEEEEDKADEPKTKTVTETVQEWKRINTAKAIWTRNPKDIKDEEYNEFYKSLTKDTNGYLTKIHFTAEGEIAFRSILYVPKQAEWNLYDKFYEKSTSLKLYVRKVLISDEFDDFLPKYMNFVKGVVDSDDLPLNVSRETLAQSKVLQVMAKKITRKVLEMLTNLAEAGEEKEEEGGEDDITIADKSNDYESFWKQYGKSLKLGIMDDRANRAKLAKLLRYVSSKSEGKFISFDQYVARMKEDQKHIYYITGENIESVQNSPMLERLKKLDLEVLYMVDPLDEYVVGQLTEYDGNTLQSVTKKDLKLPGVDDNIEELQKEYAGLCTYLQKVYGKKTEKVEVGTRITSSPAVLVTAQYGWTANMERIMRAQTMADADKYSYMAAKKTMEINPHHPIIKELRSKVESGADDKGLEDLAQLMYDAALVSSGFQITESADFATRITRVVALGLGVDPNAEVETQAEKAAEKPETVHDDL